MSLIFIFETFILYLKLMMKKNEFIEEVKDLSQCAIQNANNLLKLIDRDVCINWENIC